MPRQYPPEFRQRAVRMVEEALPDHATEFEAIKMVASCLGLSPKAVSRWHRKERSTLDCVLGSVVIGIWRSST